LPLLPVGVCLIAHWNFQINSTFTTFTTADYNLTIVPFVHVHGSRFHHLVSILQGHAWQFFSKSKEKKIQIVLLFFQFLFRTVFANANSHIQTNGHTNSIFSVSWHDHTLPQGLSNNLSFFSRICIHPKRQLRWIAFHLLWFSVCSIRGLRVNQTVSSFRY
jgi:hypothetical protein